jgi:hypothetical protein
MTILTEILKYFNAIIEQSKLYERVYGLAEYSDKEKRYIRYISDGQYEQLHDFDRYAGTFFWVKSGKTLISPARNQIDGCMTDIQVQFNIRAVSVIQKRLLKCDSADYADYVALTTLKLLQNSEKKLQNLLGLKSIALNGVSYEPKITGIENDKNYSQVSIDFQLIITAKQDCFNNDICIDTSSIPIEIIKKACVDILVEGQELPNPLTANFVAGNNVQISIDIDGNIVISGIGGIQSVTGLDTDNSDPANPVVQIAVDGVTITGDGTAGNPLVSTAIGGVQTVTDDGNGVVSVDNTDPINPVIEFNGVNVDGITITGDGTALNPLVGASSFALTIKEDGTTVDSNVDEIDFIAPLEANQTSAGKVEVSINNSALGSKMFEVMYGQQLQNTYVISYVQSENKIFVPSSSNNNVQVLDATTFELLATVSITNVWESSYIPSLNEVWAARQGNNQPITRINAATNAVIGTIAVNTNAKRQYLEYTPISGNNRVFVTNSGTDPQPAGSSIGVIDTVTFAANNILITAGNGTLSAVIIDNPASAMHRHLIITQYIGATFGLIIINCETNAIVIQGLVPTGATSSDRSYYIDYNPSTDEIAVTYTLSNFILILRPLTTSSFTTLNKLFITNPSAAKYDVTRNLLLVQSVFLGGNLISLLKYNSNTYNIIEALITATSSNTTTGNSINLVGTSGFLFLQGRNSNTGITHFSKLKYD